MCVAQLDRALGYGPRCRGFESSHARVIGTLKTQCFQCSFFGFYSCFYGELYVRQNPSARLRRINDISAVTVHFVTSNFPACLAYLPLRNRVDDHGQTVYNKFVSKILALNNHILSFRNCEGTEQLRVFFFSGT